MSTHDVERERRLLSEIASLRIRLEEPENTLEAIRLGEVDAFVLHENGGDKVYVLQEPAASAETRSPAERHKDEFLAMLGHELRSPLAAIASAADVLEQAGAGEPRRWALDVLRRQVRHLTRLVDDLLDVSRITAGKLELRMEAVDLASLAARVAAETKSRFEARGRTLTIHVPDEPILVQGDVTRLSQVLSNLLDNALKFTDAGGSADVSVFRRAASAVLRVRDDGIGIPADVLSGVFELFAQESTRRPAAAEGLGLGLALVRTLVERHGGHIAARSDGPGHGAEFEAVLPLLCAEAPRAPKPAGAESPGPPLRVLVVDDHADSAEALATFLLLAGHDVRTAYDGPSALESASAFRPDAVFLDIGLPGMDGHEAARRLRSLLGSEILIVALTGYGGTPAAGTKESPFDGHVLKPIDPDRLVDLLRRRH